MFSILFFPKQISLLSQEMTVWNRIEILWMKLQYRLKIAVLYSDTMIGQCQPKSVKICLWPLCKLLG